MIIRTDASFTRPANTTAYAQGDVVGPAAGAAVQSFAVPYSRAVVVGAVVSSTAALGALTVLVYETSFTPSADNAAMVAPGFSNPWRAAFVLGNQITPGALTTGFQAIEDTTLAGTYGTIWMKAYPVNITNGTIYGVVVVTDPAAFTPASGQQFNVSLFVDVPQAELGRF